ncbi:MFS transporter [Bradyrhizobium sp. CB1650]|uniref:MFS transporter n=1 Tax=Bradyrhizobium sp. CB1650 TaxID=3039153 RepID=UPI002434F8EF|nr:MFS transporter [Bradyrhizobium sp. CB1650]WGD53320.1 MFS transporter [Bradyrhizobium sp. CB1650]
MSVTKVPAKAWAIVALLFGFMMINFADKIIVGLAGVPIMTDLQLTPKQFGLGGIELFLLFSISAVVTGFLVNRIRSKWALLAMGVVWALVQFPMLGTIGIEALIACRIVLGAGEGPAYPVALHAAYKWFPDDRRTLPSAIISQGASIGVIIVVPLLTWIITKYSWHSAFGTLGAVGLLWVLLWAIWGAEGEGDVMAKPVNSGEADHIPYGTLLLNPTNLASWCSYFGAYFGLALVLSWFTPWLIKVLGFSQAVAGQLTALPFVVGFVVVISGGWLSEWMMRRGWGSRVARGLLTGAALVIGGLALLAAPYVAGVALKIALVLVGVAVPSIVYATSPAMLGEITPPQQRGAILGINSAVGTSAGILAPYLMGSMIEGAASAAEGYGLGFSICGLVTLVGGIIGLLFLHPEAQRARFAVLKPAAIQAG